MAEVESTADIPVELDFPVTGEDAHLERRELSTKDGEQSSNDAECLSRNKPQRRRTRRRRRRGLSKVLFSCQRSQKPA